MPPLDDTRVLTTYRSVFTAIATEGDTNNNINKNAVPNTGNKNNIDALTSLPLTTSLLSDLKRLMLLKNGHWFLAMLNIDNLKQLNETVGYAKQQRNFKLSQIAKIIKDFCQESPSRLKPYRDNAKGSRNLFAILILSKNSEKFAQYILSFLMNQIHDITKVTVSIGLSSIIIDSIKLNAKYSFIIWRQCALYCMEIAKQNGGNRLYFEDFNNNLRSETLQEIGINVNKIEILMDDIECKETEPTLAKQQQKRLFALKNETEFDQKQKEIALNEGTNWILALINGDDIPQFEEKFGSKKNAVRNEQN